MPDVIIRLAGPEDAADLQSADVFDGPANPAATRAFLGSVAVPDPRNILVLAELSGRIVGFASATVLDHPDKPRALFIQELGVNEDVRHRGIGRALLAAVRAEGQRRGCQLTWLATEGDNAAALSLYRSAGGQETGDLIMFEWDEAADGS